MSRPECECYITDDRKACAAYEHGMRYEDVIVPCLCDCHDYWNAANPRDAGKE